MPRFVTIKHKLIVINLLTLGMALLVTVLALLLTEYLTFRKSLMDNVATQAKILANDVADMVHDNDRRGASSDLRALQAASNIQRGIIFGKDGRVFAEYRRDPSAPPGAPVPKRTGSDPFLDQDLHVFQDVVKDGRALGTIYLQSDLADLDTMLSRYVLIAAAVMTATFIIVLMMLNRFQKAITVPILSLARTMQTVTRGKDYDLRAEILGDDETGQLAAGFNEMLEQMRQRDMKLRMEIAERKQAAEHLNEATSRVVRLLRFNEALLSAIPTPVFYKDREGRYLGCNRAFSDLMGESPERIRGKTAEELWPERHADVYLEKDRELMDHPGRQAYEFKVRDKEEKERTVIFAKDVYLDETGAAAGIVGAFLDITEQKEAEERLRQAKEEWDRTFDAIVDPVMIVDDRHRIVKANRAMAAKLGITPAEAVGLDCYAAVHGADAPPQFCPHTELLTDGLPHSVEVSEERLGGHFIVSVSPLMTPEGKMYGSVHYARDITERKMAEESIRRLNEELEQKIQERTRQLLDAQEELIRKEKLAILGQLAGSVGHELRNPLGVMNNAVYFLKTVIPRDHEGEHEYLDIIKNEIETSRHIITDLLDFARAKTPQKREVPVPELIGNSISRCQVPPSVTVEMEIPETLPALLVDPVQMGQVLENLITNAVQAMAGGGTLRITACRAGDTEAGMEECPAGAGECIELTLADTGEGIAPENMRMLFQPLFTTKARGIGLGLCVSRIFVEANGGRIGVESKVGEGTVFKVILPVGENLS